MTTCKPNQPIPDRPARWCRILLLCMGGVAAVGAGCSRPADVTEAGALLLRISVPAGGPVPDALRVWTYDDRGVLFKNVPIPQGGALVPATTTGPELGTVLIQPGVSVGQLRLHVRGLLGVDRILDGVARVPADARARGKFDLALGTALLADGDVDDVPDLIDDCPSYADPEQTGCPDSGTTDASVGGHVGAADASNSDAGAGGGGGTSGAGGDRGTGGSEGTGGMTGTGGKTNGGSDAAVADANGTDVRVSDAQPRDTQAAETARRSLGATCTASSECLSAFCVDGVCCQTSCSQPCEVCGTSGRCLAVTKGQDVPECAGTNTCNNRGKCVSN